ncbi:probetacellulin isoform X10 [Grus americana]|nr:probetacellulin isoform X10 [Grus americana]
MADGRTDPCGLALALLDLGRAGTAQNALRWEQRPLQGSAPAPAASLVRRRSRPGRARGAMAVPVLPVPGRRWWHRGCRVAVPTRGKAHPGARVRITAPRQRAPRDTGREDEDVPAPGQLQLSFGSSSSPLQCSWSPALFGASAPLQLQLIPSSGVSVAPAPYSSCLFQRSWLLARP